MKMPGDGKKAFALTGDQVYVNNRYLSARFITTGTLQALRIMVSTSGLLIREYLT